MNSQGWLHGNVISGHTGRESYYHGGQSWAVQKMGSRGNCSLSKIKLIFLLHGSLGIDGQGCGRLAVHCFVALPGGDRGFDWHTTLYPPSLAASFSCLPLSLYSQGHLSVQGCRGNIPALLLARKRAGEALAKGRCLLLPVEGSQKLLHGTLVYTLPAQATATWPHVASSVLQSVLCQDQVLQKKWRTESGAALVVSTHHVISALLEGAFCLPFHVADAEGFSIVWSLSLRQSGLSYAVIFSRPLVGFPVLILSPSNSQPS